MEESIKSAETDDDYNPLRSYDENSLVKFYKGSSIFSSKKASQILSHLDTVNFDTYLENNLTESAQEVIFKNLYEIGIEADIRNYAEICAGIFVDILKKIAAKQKTIPLKKLMENCLIILIQITKEL